MRTFTAAGNSVTYTIFSIADLGGNSIDGVIPREIVETVLSSGYMCIPKGHWKSIQASLTLATPGSGRYTLIFPFSPDLSSGMVALRQAGWIIDDFFSPLATGGSMSHPASEWVFINIDGPTNNPGTIAMTGKIINIGLRAETFKVRFGNEEVEFDTPFDLEFGYTPQIGDNIERLAGFEVKDGRKWNGKWKATRGGSVAYESR